MPMPPARSHPLRRGLVVVLAATLVGLLAPAGPAAGAPEPDLLSSAGAAKDVYRHGAAGVGDPYYPKDGNGGIDVQHYGLALDYRPRTDRLTGRATIRVRATENLDRFNLDLDGLRVGKVSVEGRRARWSRSKGELMITPYHALTKGHVFVVVVDYTGKPKPLRGDGGLGRSGFFPTDDGMVVQGEPHGASTWYPANDHPSDKATYRFDVPVPKGLEAVANGRLARHVVRGADETWTWVAANPMASYLATVNVGQFDIESSVVDGVRYTNAVDPDVHRSGKAPRTGSQYAFALDTAQPSWRRLTRTIAVPDGGGTLSFWIDRRTDGFGNFVAVEARTPAKNDWTTLPDQSGHTRRPSGDCAFLIHAHPFLKHYVSSEGRKCRASGTTGVWRAATGKGRGWEHWVVDLGAWKGRSVEISLASVQTYSDGDAGDFVDDITASGGSGSTSFERDADVRDGWRTATPPTGEHGRWQVGGRADTVSVTGRAIKTALKAQPAIVRFLSGRFGRYPWRQSGAIVDDLDTGFALETQTRPVYGFTYANADAMEGVIAHELAHQWFGDRLRLRRWSDLWLNEGFATYAEWLWNAHHTNTTMASQFASGEVSMSGWWHVPVTDLGQQNLFASPVAYERGAMTLHRLRQRVGDRDFWLIMQSWVRQQRGGTVTTKEFTTLAERISGDDLDHFFDVWLRQPKKPASLR